MKKLLLLFTCVLLSACSTVHKCYCEWAIQYPNKTEYLSDTCKVYSDINNYTLNFSPKVYCEEDSSKYYLIWGPNLLYSNKTTVSKYKIELLTYKIIK